MLQREREKEIKNVYYKGSLRAMLILSKTLFTGFYVGTLTHNKIWWIVLSDLQHTLCSALQKLTISSQIYITWTELQKVIGCVVSIVVL